MERFGALSRILELTGLISKARDRRTMNLADTAGGDCLPAKMLIREFSVKYSPSLEKIVENFSDLNKKSKNK